MSRAPVALRSRIVQSIGVAPPMTAVPFCLVPLRGAFRDSAILNSKGHIGF
jgi:hypothetical protein